MNKAKKKQQAIRQKLMAAIAMLMVSAIMVVSSSYAWFTLSTAPEVTGIQTSVGANGNLEMALNNGGTITSSVGDAIKSDLERNVTWGNLVDLSNEAYGLNKSALMPARLNWNGTEIGASHLSTPSYGPDGRVDSLVTESLSRAWNVTNNNWSGTGNGVMAIGNASGLSDEQLALRQAKIDFANNISAAMVGSATSLNTTGPKLTAMAVSVKMDGQTEVAKDDVQAVLDTVNTLLTAEGKLETALYNYLQAMVLNIEATNPSALPDGATALNVIANNTDLASLASALDSALSADAAFTAAYAKLSTLKDTLTATQTGLGNALSGLAPDATTVAWNTISAHMVNLVNVDTMVLNDTPITDIDTNDEDAVSNLASDILAAGGLELTTTGGVYSEIAAFTGTFTASFKLGELSVKGIKLKDLPAAMTAEPTVTPQYNTTFTTAMNAFSAKENEAASSALTDVYGYKIDLAFRTNAAGSYLKLQTEAADRIYDDNATDAETRGGGSYMEFDIATLGYTKEQAKDIMGAIRIVFMETTSNDTDGAAIYGVAVLDTDNAQENANGWKATMKMVETTFTADGNNGYKLTIGADKTGEEKDKLIELPQSTKTEMSVLVYLDGEYVENADVATVAQSLTGDMNLQFASSAELKPMEYSDLHLPGGNNP